MDQINQKLREELETKANIITSLCQVRHEREQDKLFKTPEKKSKLQESPNCDRKSAHESADIIELQKYIKELEGRTVTLTNDVETLRAELTEADWYVYDRGGVKEEIQNLRRTNITNLQEIFRLTSENQRKTVELAHAEEGWRYAVKNNKAKMVPQPPPERSSQSQTCLNFMYQTARVAS